MLFNIVIFQYYTRTSINLFRVRLGPIDQQKHCSRPTPDELQWITAIIISQLVTASNCAYTPLIGWSRTRGIDIYASYIVVTRVNDQTSGGAGYEELSFGAMYVPYYVACVRCIRNEPRVFFPPSHLPFLPYFSSSFPS